MPTEQWRLENADKMRAYRREWYNKNRKHAKSKVVERREVMKKWLVDYKSKLSCTKCGESHPGTLDFHHNGSSKKDFVIAQVVNYGYSIETILKEISKCVVLCANCHRKHHWNEKHNGS